MAPIWSHLKGNMLRTQSYELSVHFLVQFVVNLLQL